MNIYTELLMLGGYISQSELALALVEPQQNEPAQRRSDGIATPTAISADLHPVLTKSAQ